MHVHFAHSHQLWRVALERSSCPRSGELVALACTPLMAGSAWLGEFCGRSFLHTAAASLRRHLWQARSITCTYVQASLVLRQNNTLYTAASTLREKADQHDSPHMVPHSTIAQRRPHSGARLCFIRQHSRSGSHTAKARHKQWYAMRCRGPAAQLNSDSHALHCLHDEVVKSMSGKQTTAHGSSTPY